MAGSDQPLVLGLVSSAIAILASIFGFMHVRINRAQDEVKESIATMRTEMDARLREGRDDRASLWSAVRSTEREVGEQHRRLLERMSEVATRQEIKEDLAASERRIAQMLQNWRGRPS